MTGLHGRAAADLADDGLDKLALPRAGAAHLLQFGDCSAELPLHFVVLRGRTGTLVALRGVSAVLQQVRTCLALLAEIAQRRAQLHVLVLHLGNAANGDEVRRDDLGT